MKILLTGFEPFDGSTINPSAEIVQKISEDIVSGHHLIKKILPVDNLQAVAWIEENLPIIQPDIILHLGEASSRSVITIEKVAINWMDFRIPDNAGKQIKDQPVIAGAPDAYFTSLPVDQIIDNVKEAWRSIELCVSAGAYLCNQVFYTSMHYTRLQNKEWICGFIHLPSMPEQVVHKKNTSPSMGLPLSLKAIELALTACVNQ